MIRVWNGRRAPLKVLFVLLAAGVTALWLLSPTETVIFEGDVPPPVTHEELMTPEALARAAAGARDGKRARRQSPFVSWPA